MNREWGVHGIGWMSSGACDSRQVIVGAVRGSTQMQRGGQKVKGMPRSEQECWNEQKWMGAQKWLGDLSSRQKLSGEWTGERTYWTDAEGQEKGWLDVEK